MTRKIDQSSQQGALQVPLGMGLAVAAMFALGLILLIGNWRGIVELQLRLDRCVARTGLELRDRLNAIEQGNLRIHGIRLALLPASLAPPVRATLQAALNAEVLHQTMLLWAWKARRGTWLLRRGCDGKTDLALPLPEMPWFRDPPDSLGQRPLRWTGPKPGSFIITLWHRPRACRARIHKDRGGKWRAEWAAPAVPL